MMVPYGEMICDKCGKEHGYVPGVFRKWHECDTCGAIYCPECGQKLEPAGWTSPNRICPNCGGKTTLVD